MKNEKLFNETIDKLVNAYFDGVLSHKDCTKCAVGNIVCDGQWGQVFKTVKTSAHKTWFGEYPIIVRSDSTYSQVARYHTFDFSIYPYTKDELQQIEWAFETAPKEGDWEFNGLMAVVDVLMVIHECDQPTVDAAKQKFVKQAV